MTLRNHPDKPTPTKKRGLRYQTIKNPALTQKWSWRCRGLDGGGSKPVYAHIGTLKFMLDQYKRYTGLLQFHQDHSQFFYGQREIAQIWTLTQIRSYSDMHHHRAHHNPNQATLWSAGMIDVAPTEAIYDFAWTPCTYHTLLEIRPKQTVHLFTKNNANPT